MQRASIVSPLYVPPINPIPSWYEVRGGSWRVPLSTVQALRLLVEAEIGHNQNFDLGRSPSTRAIQYRGETVDGNRIVRLIGACNGLGSADWKLSERFVQVFDGGKCYFDADYRVDDRQFRLRYNGSA